MKHITIILSVLIEADNDAFISIWKSQYIDCTYTFNEMIFINDWLIDWLNNFI